MVDQAVDEFVHSGAMPLVVTELALIEVAIWVDFAAVSVLKSIFVLTFIDTAIGADPAPEAFRLACLETSLDIVMATLSASAFGILEQFRIK